MKSLFVDSSALVALGDDTDDHYKKADRFFRNQLGATRFITSDFVLDETLTLLSRRIGATNAVAFATNAVAFAHGLLASRAYRVYYVDAALLAMSLDFLVKYADKGVSFTDATTMAFVRTQHISKVFTFDSDFRKLGFEVVP